MSIEIHRAKGTEAPELSAIAFAAKRYWGYPEEWIKLWSDELTISAAYVEANWVFSAKEAGRTVGWVAVTKEQEDYWLDHCWVLPEAVGRGVGTRLVYQAFAVAGKMRSATLKVIADPHAEGFYRKFGFRRIGDHPSVPEGRLLPVLEARREELVGMADL